MVEAREELCGILENDEMRNVPLIVVANKQDLPSKWCIDVRGSAPPSM
jgi:signal recognition particle receptor subunit beta